MDTVKAGAGYFLWVFGAGFALACVRIPFLVPSFGMRVAELLEAPVMLAVIAWASYRLVRQHRGWSRARWLGAGLVALACLVAAELALAYGLDGRSPGQYIASRDPVSGGVYLASLVVFAVAPTLWSGRRRHD
ncbi:hypothetical protein [Dyella sp.]|jgi:hypothetical protein|uniref:hypothetical protein n=1 Tax=Dyella sp. TaxID=1869338 RepID=UPI002D78E620|nr:hypothetical protein [Dyella sp.]HET6431114.1 hypothetical protein [Dyella sp.]